MQPACVEACPADVFAFGDLNDPGSAIRRFQAKHGNELVALKPQEGTRSAVHYRGIGTVVPRAVENKLPKGRNHDPFTYEIDTWAELRADYGTVGGNATGKPKHYACAPRPDPPPTCVPRKAICAMPSTPCAAPLTPHPSNCCARWMPCCAISPPSRHCWKTNICR